MDDIRIFLMAIRLGWRWTDGGLRYRSSWRLEEEQAELNKKQVEQFKQQKLELVKHKTSKEVHLSGVAGDSSNVSCSPPEGRGGYWDG